MNRSLLMIVVERPVLVFKVVLTRYLLTLYTHRENERELAYI